MIACVLGQAVPTCRVLGAEGSAPTRGSRNTQPFEVRFCALLTEATFENVSGTGVAVQLLPDAALCNNIVP